MKNELIQELIERTGLCLTKAQALAEKARKKMWAALENEDVDAASDIFNRMIGLAPEWIDVLIN